MTPPDHQGDLRWLRLFIVLCGLALLAAAIG